MNAEPVLVDTSVWVQFFNRPDSLEAEIVRELLEQERVVLAGVVIAELIQGVKSKTERDLLLETLSILPYLEADRADWTAAGWRLRELRGQGITVPVTDAILAQLCLGRGVALFSLDRHFDHFAGITRIRTASSE